MEFSTDYQPRYAVYVHRGSDRILVARYGSLARAIVARDTLFEYGETVSLDVN